MEYKPFITLRACRVNAGLTQDELASKLGVSAATINSWEQGNTKITVDKLMALSELSNVPMNCIILCP